MNDRLLIPNSWYLQSDLNFSELFPYYVRSSSTLHWTPLHIARYAAEFLDTGGNCRILDIGSGVGKFCLTGASYRSDAEWYGIEQRPYLVKHARNALNVLGYDNVTFLEGNFTTLNLKQFDHFYFFNSFFENIEGTDKIDNTIEYSEALYEYYVQYLHKVLGTMPGGTRIATFHSLQEEIPGSYKLVESLEGGDLKFWIKK